MLAHSIPLRNEIRSLTGIRGIAACIVVFYHYFQGMPEFRPLHTAISHSYVAVDLFFVLSGFVMAMTYGQLFFGDFSATAYASFLGKRLGRVYPVYIVVTAVVAGLVYAHAIEDRPPSSGMVLSNMLMVQAWGFGDSIDGPTWSISTEFAAYLVFPALVALVLVGHVRRCWVAGVGAVAALAFLARIDSATLNQVVGGVGIRNGPADIYGIGTIFPLLRCLAGFVLGLVAFRLSSRPAIRSVFGWRHSGDVAALVVATLWAVHGTDVLLEVAFVPLVIALASGGSWIARIMAGGFVFWLGEISYSIYLTHLPIDKVIRRPLTAMLDANHVPHAHTAAGFVPLAVTILFSAAAFYGIEKPARDWSRRLMGSKIPHMRSESATP